MINLRRLQYRKRTEDYDGTSKPVGLCFAAIDAVDFQLCEKIETGRSDREYNRYVTGSRALNLARKYMEEK